MQLSHLLRTALLISSLPARATAQVCSGECTSYDLSTQTMATPIGASQSTTFGASYAAANLFDGSFTTMGATQITSAGANWQSVQLPAASRCAQTLHLQPRPSLILYCVRLRALQRRLRCHLQPPRLRQPPTLARVLRDLRRKPTLDRGLRFWWYLDVLRLRLLFRL